jgi:hypothetical protein
MRWYKRDCDSYRSTSGLQVLEILGLEGYARWAILLEIIGEEMDGETPNASRTMPVSEWCRLLRCRPKQLEKLLGTLTEVAQKLGRSHSEVAQELLFFSVQNGMNLTIGEPKMLLKMDDTTQRVRRKSEHNAAQIEIESKIEIKKEKEKKDIVVSAKPEADPCPSFQHWWNQTICAISASIPKCQKLNETRRRQIKARIAEGFDFEAVEAAIRNSKRFLQGGDGKFTVHLDFILQPSSYTKLIEGNYADLKQPYTNGKPLYEQPKTKQPPPRLPEWSKIGTLSTDKQWYWTDIGWEPLR